MAEKIYQQICSISKKAALYKSIENLLEWDLNTSMPEKGIALKTTQSILLQEQYHLIMTSKKYKHLLSQLIDIESGSILSHELSPQQMHCIQALHKDYLYNKKLPNAFRKEYKETQNEMMPVWQEAKKRGSFSLFLPLFRKIIQLAQKQVHFLGYKEHPYDALLDIYEPNLTVSHLDPIFNQLSKMSASIIKIAQENQNPSVQDLFTNMSFPISQQKALCQCVLQALHLPHESYHFAESYHPLCIGIGPHDVRLTTHYHEDNFLKAFFSTIHETGHALYESNLPKEHFGTPLGEPASFSIHESQSRFYETFLGHSRPFLQAFWPTMQELFPDIKKISFNDLYHSINFIQPNPIRIYADELTYNLHIILRYNIEKALIEGSLQPEEVPRVWKEQMQQLLHITPKNESEGSLQDIHWALGYFGYFPSYTLGNIYAGTLFQTFAQETPQWQEEVLQKNFHHVNLYLHQTIHKYGREYPPHELICKATKKRLSLDLYIQYLTEKYGGKCTN